MKRQHKLMLLGIVPSFAVGAYALAYLVSHIRLQQAFNDIAYYCQDHYRVHGRLPDGFREWDMTYMRIYPEESAFRTRQDRGHEISREFDFLAEVRPAQLTLAVWRRSDPSQALVRERIPLPRAPRR